MLWMLWDVKVEAGQYGSWTELPCPPVGASRPEAAIGHAFRRLRKHLLLPRTRLYRITVSPNKKGGI